MAKFAQAFQQNARAGITRFQMVDAVTSGANEVDGIALPHLIPVGSGVRVQLLKQGDAPALILGPVADDGDLAVGGDLAVSGDLTVGGQTAAVSLGGTYTPGLTSLSVGTTNAINEATWSYSGGPSSGDPGQMIVTGRLVWGTAGTRTYPTAASRIGLPSGFVSASVNTSIEAPSFWRGPSSIGVIRIQTNTNAAIHLLRLATSGADASVLNPTATTPHTWGPGDTVVWSVALQVVRT